MATKNPLTRLVPFLVGFDVAEFDSGDVVLRYVVDIFDYGCGSGTRS